MHSFNSVTNSLNTPPLRQPTPNLNHDLMSKVDADYKIIAAGLDNSEVFEIAERITLADLLEHPAASIETLSMIRNVLHYAYVFPDPEDECEVNDVFHEINEALANRVFTTAFEMLKYIKTARRNNELPRKTNVVNRYKKKRVEPVVVKIPDAPQLDRFKAEEQVRLWIKKCRKEKISTFQVEELQKFVEQNYLSGLTWCIHDKVVVTSNTPRWKQTCSTALQRLQEDGDIRFRKGKRDSNQKLVREEHWYVFPD